MMLGQNMKGEHMENAFTDKFDKETYHGQQIETPQDENGRFFRATIKHDDSGSAPWENEDGHGPVSKWRRKDSKAPGERILCEDRGSCRFYDMQEATKIARKDGWRCANKTHEHKTRGEEIACAVQQDFERLEGWCNDRWFYVGIVISFHQEIDDEEIELSDHLASFWGIDNDAGDDLTEVANDLLTEAKENDEAKRLLVKTE